MLIFMKKHIKMYLNGDITRKNLVKIFGGCLLNAVTIEQLTVNVCNIFNIFIWMIETAYTII